MLAKGAVVLAEAPPVREEMVGVDMVAAAMAVEATEMAQQAGTEVVVAAV